MGGILDAIGISSRGLSVQRSKMNAVAENMANAETTRTPEGGPYQRKRVVVSEEKPRNEFSRQLRQANDRLVRTHSNHRPGLDRTGNDDPSGRTVEMETVREQGFRMIHDPSHPDADPDGYVKMPDIDIITEMVDMMAASRHYEANTVAISAAKKMANDALDI